jgi:subtilisin-like proprotein convertase family protein
MYMIFSRISILASAILFLILCQPASSQTTEWTILSRADLESRAESFMVEAEHPLYFGTSFEELNEKLLSANDGDLISLPTGENEFERFVLTVNSTMHSDLDARYPSIRSFNIQSQSTRITWGKLSISPKGLKALILRPGQPILFFDPVLSNDRDKYILYTAENYLSDEEMVCHVSGQTEIDFDFSERGASGNPYSSCELKIYELAVTANGEYSQQQGGTIELTLASIVGVINRINAIYERDFAATTTLVPNTDELIYLDPETDPFTNSSTFAMLDENINVTNSTIGSNNYDIGHIFGLGSGGVAFLNSACSSFKAGCVSRLTSNNPGSPYDIGLVGHEMGHQMSGNHSYNNECEGNRNNFTAVEPGSGSTIMSYAGICAPNVQSVFSPYYHGRTMAEIGPSIVSDFCTTTQPLDNIPPELEALPSEILIPVSTPFLLTAAATDEDGDTLTYNWEQMDNEISTQPPQSQSTGGPMFRSFSPTISPTRYFPALPNAQESTWEQLPAVQREMNFRVSVKDNAPFGGCTQFDDITVQVVGNAGPFRLEYPSDPGIVWNAFTDEVILWDVANTTAAPLNAETVDIFLSINGGLDFDIQLADDYPNTGSFPIEVPPYPTTTAKIMVINSGGTFFDISDFNFRIESISEGFDLLQSQDEITICQGEEFNYTLGAGAAFGFEGSIELTVNDLPDGIEVNLSEGIINPGEESAVTVNTTSDIEVGTYEISISGVSGEFEDTETLILLVNESDLTASEPLAPTQEEVLPAVYNFVWSESISPEVTYTLEIALDEDFNDLLEVFPSLLDTSLLVSNLPPIQTMYWRVITNSICGFAISPVSVFNTESCGVSFPQNLPVDLPAEAITVTSEVDVLIGGTIASVRLTNLNGLHTRMRDLTATLTSPTGTEIMLFDSICGSDDNFNFSFSDEGLTEMDCPPTTGLFYTPLDPLSIFAGEDALGTWTLTVTDEFFGAGGVIEGWELEICYVENVFGTTELDLFDVAIYPNPSEGLFQISLGNPDDAERISIFDIRGKLLKTMLVNRRDFIEFDLSSFASGTYLLHVQGSVGSSAFKLIKTP